MKKIYTSDNAWSVIKHAFAEFLLVPTLIILSFLGLAYFTYNIDHAKIGWLEPSRIFLRQHVFKNSEATNSLLSAIVSGTISITSLTTTLLLVIVQQSAGSMTTQVFDQFLRRRSNQFYLGFFVGLSLYSMITLSTVNEPFNPVWGGTLAFSLTAMALYLLVLLMYTTINQMRPVEIINAIYERILFARKRQVQLLEYSVDQLPGSAVESGKLLCRKGGYLSTVNMKALSHYMEKQGIAGYVVLLHSIGNYIAFDEPIARFYNVAEAQLEALKKELIRCISIRLQRNIDFDTTYGIQQLQIIAWTSTSTAQSNPGPGQLCIRKLHDIMNCWAQDKPTVRKSQADRIIYTDNAVEALMTTLENVAVVTSESMQHQVLIDIINLFSDTLGRVPLPWQQRMEKIVLIMLSVMGDHVLTTALETALGRLIVQLQAAGMTTTAHAVDMATQKLKESLGKLNSRSTRV